MITPKPSVSWQASGGLNAGGEGSDQQIAVSKDEVGGRTVARAATLDVEGRIVELSRMLSGQPDSATARRHAEELLAFGNGKGASRPSSTYRARAR